MRQISDIIVNQSNPANLQLSQNIKDSQPQNSTTSFAELVNLYKSSENESKPVEHTEEPAQVSEPVEAEVSKNESVQENKIEAAETKVVEKSNPSEEKSEKIAEKMEADTTDKKVPVKTAANKTKKNTEALEEKAEKKALDIEFENLEVFEEYTAALIEKNVPEVKENQVKEDKTSDIKVDVSSQIEISLEQNLQVSSVDNEAEMDFTDLLNEESKSAKNELKLDKDGKISVQDLRTQVSEDNSKENLKLKTQTKITGENTATITMNYAEETVQADVLSLNNQAASADGSTFQTMLNNQIQANVPEFVKAGNIVLKDNNQGTINLVLHPDDLGNVKIHLNVDGKTLTGHITVATKEALQVFKDNSETLREAFIKNGFDAANFEVSYGNGSGNQNMAFDQQNDGTNLFGKKMYSSIGGAVESESSEFFENSESFGNYSVNIVA